MVIAFTGAFHGQAGTTTNMAALALYLTQKTRTKTVLLSLQPRYSLLDGYLCKSRGMLQKKDEDKGAGIETLRKLVKSGLADKEGVQSCMTPINAHLDLLTGNFPSVLERCEREYAKAAPDMLQCLSEYYELIFCDMGSKESELFRAVIERASLLVQNLSQNAGLLEACLNKMAEWKRAEDVFYLFGCYDQQSKYSLYNLRHRYHSLTAANSAVMPYCTEIRDACSDGTLPAALKKLQAAKTAEHYKGVYIGLQDAAAVMIRLLERRGKKFIL